MNTNLKFFFDRDGTPRARGPHTERTLMTFLETDVQGSDHICHDLMDDLTAVEEDVTEVRDFEGNAHSVTLSCDGVLIEPREKPATGDNPTADTPNAAGAGVSPQPSVSYRTGLKHFRQILEDWEAFILDDLNDLDDPEAT